MKKAILFPLLALSLPALAQPPAQPTPEQMQKAMLQQAVVMSVMYDLRKSRLGFEETISAIKSGAEKRGWQVGAVQDMQAQMREAGAKDAKRMKVVHLCPAGANEKVAKAAGGKAPPLPCRARPSAALLAIAGAAQSPGMAPRAPAPFPLPSAGMAVALRRRRMKCRIARRSCISVKPMLQSP